MPFLEVLTRHLHTRPRMLAANVDSLKTQTDRDFYQFVLVDAEGIGVEAANARLADHTPHGEWVWVLDDDDCCIHDGLVADLKAIIKNAPETQVVMVRMDHGPGLGVLPDESSYARRMIWHGRIGCSGSVVRRDVWLAHRQAWATGQYDSDWYFIKAVFLAKPVVYWHDVVASRVQRRSNGAPE